MYIQVVNLQAPSFLIRFLRGVVFLEQQLLFWSLAPPHTSPFPLFFYILVNCEILYFYSILTSTISRNYGAPGLEECEEFQIRTVY